MKAKILGLLAVGLLAGPMQAFAVPMDYTITFTTTSGVAPTSGSFTYDSSVPTFTNFLVEWGGFTFDLTSAANSPSLFGNSCGFAAGPAGSFAFLSNPAAGGCTGNGWEALTGGGAAVDGYFGFVGSGNGLFGMYGYIPPDGGSLQKAAGTGWAISPATVAEPGTLALLGLGLAGLGLSRRRKAA